MLSIIFLSYNRKDELNKTLGDFSKQVYAGDLEAIVIDQGSDDGTDTMVTQNYPWIRFIKLNQNYGVPGGRNMGAHHARGDYLVFLDDDTSFINNDALTIIHETFTNDLNINIIGFNIFNNKNHMNHYKKDFFTYQFIGCGHAIRKTVFDRLNGYADELFFWGEEIEFSLNSFRIPNNKIIFKSDILLHHRGASTSRINWNNGRSYYKVRNRLAITFYLYPAGYMMFIFIYYVIVYFLRSVQFNAIKDYVRGIKDYRKVQFVNSARLTNHEFHKILWLSVKAPNPYRNIEVHAY
jgi:GT2 family glycosyltransferase